MSRARHVTATAWSVLLLMAVSGAVLSAVAGLVIAFVATDDKLATHLGFGGLFGFLALGLLWLLGLALLSEEAPATPLWAARALRSWKATVFGLFLLSGLAVVIGFVVSFFDDEDTLISTSGLIAWFGFSGLFAFGLALLLGRLFWRPALGELADGPDAAGVTRPG